jgi:tetratricopeptide (TPR) repeat protein
MAPPGRKARRVDMPLIGREHELTMLNGLVDGAFRRSRAATVVIVGEAGVGKSRLVEELSARAIGTHGALVLDGACVPYGEANVWWPIAESLRSAMAVPPGTPAGDTRRRCQEWVGEAMAHASVDEVDRVAEGLLHLLGEPSSLAGIDPTRAREEVSRSLLAHIEGWASQRPVVVAISDLHWADDAVLTLGKALTERHAHLPIVFLGTARDGLLDRWHPSSERTNHAVLHLDPLDTEAAAQLLEALACDIDDEMLQLVLDRSGGNPFFLEELARLLGEDRADRGVPHSLRGLVAARLDALDPLERSLVDSGAILGRKFPRMAVHLMAEKYGTAAHHHVERALADLVAEGVLEPAGDDMLTFRSGLVREVAYDTLTKAARAKGHLGVADWIERHLDSSGANRDTVAHHYAAAAALVGEIGQVEGVPPDLPRRAVEALLHAMETAAAEELHNTVRRYADQALSLPAAALDPPVRVRFLLARADAAAGLRTLDGADADIAEARAVAEATGDPLLLADVDAVHGLIEQKRGDLASSIVLLDDAVRRYRAAGEARRTADALLDLGTSHLFAGAADTSEEAFAEALELFRGLDDRRGEAWAVQNLAWTAYSAGRIDAADAAGSASLAIFEDLGDRGGMAWAHGLQAFVRYHQGRFEEAEALADGVLDEAEDRDDPWAIGMMLALRGSLRLWTGRSAAAIAPAEQATDRFREMGDWYGQLLAQGVLGRALIAQGRIDDGFAQLDEAATVAAATTSSAAPGFAAVHRISAAAQCGQPFRAEGVAASADGADEPEIGFTDALIGEGLLHLQRGDPVAAQRQLEGLATALGERLSGHALSALALSRSAAGDTEGAAAAAAMVVGRPDATYLDRTTATLALALAAAREGDAEAAHRHLGQAVAVVEATDDRLARGMLTLADAVIDEALGRDVAPGAGLEAAAASPGWVTAYRLAAGVDQAEGSLT